MNLLVMFYSNPSQKCYQIYYRRSVFLFKVHRSAFVAPSRMTAKEKEKKSLKRSWSSYS